MIVLPEVAQEYRKGGASKILKVSFPGLGLELDNGNITEESFYLRESILENDSIEFVGWIYPFFLFHTVGHTPSGSFCLNLLFFRRYPRSRETVRSAPLQCLLYEWMPLSIVLSIPR